MSLIEVVVACTLLALTFTSLTALTARMAARNRSNAYAEQRTATFFEQVNRVESMPYDSLANYLTTDSAKYGQGYYVWTLHGGSRVGEHERARPLSEDLADGHAAARPDEDPEGDDPPLQVAVREPAQH